MEEGGARRGWREVKEEMRKGEGEGGAGREEVKVLRRIESVYRSAEYRVRDVKMEERKGGGGW